MLKRRWIVTVAVAALGLAVLTARYWYFLEVEHLRVASPDGRWAAVVTKRMKAFPEPVEVRLKVTKGREITQEGIDTDLDSPDVWQDVKPGSYRITWLSDAEFLVGDRDPDESFLCRGRLAGQKWMIEPAGWARQ